MLSSCQERRHDLRDEPIWSDEVSLLRQGGTQVCPTSSQTYGTGQDACVKSEPPPQSKECERFFSFPPNFLSFFDNIDTPDTVPSNKEEIRIERGKGQQDVLCYPKHNPENEEHGWCHIKVACLIPR